ncbi:protein neuralized isoform X1 [Onthophagus taurus]|uniref:protein neuralized isoform X1 n=1 Tax=Onthophagus taurus TaxID=166361 RepID=UPI0039BE386F
MGVKENGADCRCQEKTKSDNNSGTIFSPLKGKMKVLKKIKKRMGLASRSTSNASGTNNLPPLLFHNVHGDNIRISRDGTTARRVESFCKGIAFSARPVKVNEKICIKFLEISNNWSGVIRLGFTYNDPSTLRYGLPKYACPDLTNKPGYWAKALPERFCSQTTVLFYYVTSTGEVHFGINGEEKGVFFSGVETRGPLWALIDVYGNSTAIEFVDIRHQLNNSRRNELSSSYENDEVERIIYPMSAVSIHQRENEEVSYPALRHQPSQINYQPLALHRTKGKNVRFNSSRSVASRVDSEFCQGYVFTGRPLQIGERVVVQILATEPMFQGCLSLGLTSCDPSTLQPADLPDDANFLLDRPEYWVISRDFARSLNVGDEISFFISVNGEVQIRRNGASPCVIIHVDQTLKLWAFFDVYGSTRKIRVLSSTNITTPTRNPENRLITPANSESMNSINSQSELRRSSMVQNSQNRICCVPQTGELQVHSVNGFTVTLRPNSSHQGSTGAIQGQLASSHFQNQQQPHGSQHGVSQHGGNQHSGGGSQHGSSQHIVPISPVPSMMALVPGPTSSATPAIPTGTMMSNCSSTYIEPVTISSTPYSPTQTWVEGTSIAYGAGAECTICYENSIDAVLYMCGHMCMCYECALQQWRGKGGGHCPLCRAVIRDVIRTYKS